MTIVDIARVCHEANRALCLAIGDLAVPWEAAPDWQRDSACAGVEWRLAHPGAPPSAQHEQWMADKLADGWTYGLVKDAEKKAHPCLVEYSMLPAEQQAKDALFVAVVEALRPLYQDLEVSCD